METKEVGLRHHHEVEAAKINKQKTIISIIERYNLTIIVLIVDRYHIENHRKLRKTIVVSV